MVDAHGVSTRVQRGGQRVVDAHGVSTRVQRGGQRVVDTRREKREFVLGYEWRRGKEIEEGTRIKEVIM